MRIYRVLAILLLFCLMLTGCTWPSDSTKSSEDAETDVMNAMKILLDACNSKSPEVIRKYTMPESSYFWEDGSDIDRLSQSKDGLLYILTKVDKDYACNFRPGDLTVQTSGKTALVTGQIEGTINTLSGIPVTGPWRVSAGWVLDKSSWKLKHIHISKTDRLQYLVHLPKDYNTDTDKKWPLLLFLHGIGERGSDLEKIKIHGIPKIVEQYDLEGKDFPFIAISPQCPSGSNWQAVTDKLEDLLDSTTDLFRVDTNRVYLTGLSMGGFGTWALAMENPDRFAAIAPISGGVNTSRLEQLQKLKELPVWAFHGDMDSTVPIDSDQAAVDALKSYGGNVKFTIYYGGQHDVWTETYENPELYTWLLNHSKK